MTSLDHAIRYLRKTTNALRIAKIGGTVIGAGLVAGSRWVAELPYEVAGAASTATLFLGIGLVAIGALVLVFADQTAPEVIEENVRLSRSAVQHGDKVAFYERYQAHLLARLSIASNVRELLEAVTTDDSSDPEAMARVTQTLLAFFVERRATLFDIGDEYWNFSVYRYDRQEEVLFCVACRRDDAADEQKQHRVWPAGEGHVGLAFMRRAEIIFADASRPELQPVLTASASNHRDYDESRYVSLASIPISLDGSEPLGVLIATSNRPGRFKNAGELEDDEWDRADVLREAASNLAIVFGLLDAQSKGRDHEEYIKSQSERPDISAEI